MDYRQIAADWRAHQPANRAQSGYVLIWAGRVYGWKDVLRDASHERPGAVAVGVDGRCFVALPGSSESPDQAFWAWFPSPEANGELSRLYY